MNDKPRPDFICFSIPTEEEQAELKKQKYSMAIHVGDEELDKVMAETVKEYEDYIEWKDNKLRAQETEYNFKNVSEVVITERIFAGKKDGATITYKICIPDETIREIENSPVGEGIQSTFYNAIVESKVKNIREELELFIKERIQNLKE